MYNSTHKKLRNNLLNERKPIWNWHNFGAMATPLYQTTQ
jgi:hypothetical protein